MKYGVTVSQQTTHINVHSRKAHSLVNDYIPSREYKDCMLRAAQVAAQCNKRTGGKCEECAFDIWSKWDITQKEEDRIHRINACSTHIDIVE